MPAAAGSITMRSGLYVQGDPSEKSSLTLESRKRPANGIQTYYIWAIDDGMRTYFLSKQQVDPDTVEDGAFVGLETFDLPQRSIASGFAPQQLGPINQGLPFDEQGQRTVSLQTARGSKDIVQGTIELRPDWLRVDSLNLDWQYALAVSQRTDEELTRLLDAATDLSQPNDRLARVRFLLQAKRFALAEAELADAVASFPSLAERGEQFRRRLSEAYGVQAIGELRRRERAGQYDLVRRLATAFDPDRVTPGTFSQALDLVEQAEQAQTRQARVMVALESLEADLTPEQRRRIAPHRRRMLARINRHTIDRLAPFDDTIDDVGLSAEQKLAIAYSGFYAGEGQLVETLDEALQVVELHGAIRQTLAADNEYDFERAAGAAIDREGASSARVQAIIERLRPVDPLPELIAEDRDPAAAIRTSVAIQPRRGNGGGDVRVQLPPEASLDRAAGLLVVLCEKGDERDNALNFWAGLPDQPGHAQRNGLVTLAIAPTGDRAGSDPVESRDRVLDAIRTIKRRTAIDSDRVFLAGHGVGGSMALELGLSRPYDWAGVVSICGVVPTGVRSYLDFADDLSIYQVYGELDGGTLTQQVGVLEELLVKRRDVLLCEYRSRGLERYAAERDRIFEWIALHRRPPVKRFWEVTVRDGAHGDWDWLRVDDWGTGQRRTLRARLSEANSVRVTVGRVGGAVWLPDELVDFDQRVSVSINGRRSNRVLDRNPRDTLRDVWDRADQQRLYTAQIAF